MGGFLFCCSFDESLQAPLCPGGDSRISRFLKTGEHDAFVSRRSTQWELHVAQRTGKEMPLVNSLVHESGNVVIAYGAPWLRLAELSSLLERVAVSNDLPSEIRNIEGRLLIIRFTMALQKVEIASDILGAPPVFHHTRGPRCYVATNPLCIAAAIHEPFSLSREGVAQQCTVLGYAPGVSLLQGIHSNGPDSLISIGPSGITHQRIGAIEFRAPQEDPDPVESLYREFSTAISGFAQYLDEPVLALSGGLDSRVLAGQLKKTSLSFPAVTFGRPNWQEFQIARQVAQTLDVPHHLAMVERKFSRDTQRQYMIYGAMIASPSAMYTPALLGEAARQGSDLMFGYMGDSLTGAMFEKGFGVSRETGKIVVPAEYLKHWVRWTSQHGIPPNYFAPLLDQEDPLALVLPCINNVLDSFKGIEDYQKMHLTDVYFRQRPWTSTLLREGDEIGRGVSPYYSARLLRHCWSRPLEEVFQQAAYTAMLQRFFHEFQNVSRYVASPSKGSRNSPLEFVKSLLRPLVHHPFLRHLVPEPRLRPSVSVLHYIMNPVRREVLTELRDSVHDLDDVFDATALRKMLDSPAFKSGDLEVWIILVLHNLLCFKHLLGEASGSGS